MTGLSKPRSHEENGSALCGLCYKKGDLRNILPEQLKQIWHLHDKQYDPSDTKFQKVLCLTCILSLRAHTKVCTYLALVKILSMFGQRHNKLQ